MSLKCERCGDEMERVPGRMISLMLQGNRGTVKASIDNVICKDCAIILGRLVNNWWWDRGRNE